ncbi:MAG: SMI1/KNR4 family protein, partial [Pseudomonadota bacterium]
MTESFDAEEQAVLARHKMAVFENRLILDAQPPVDKQALAKIEGKLAGPLPQDLLDLWTCSFGGELDYSLEAGFGRHVQSVSFRELFYPDSKAYHDLWGWIDHEQNLTLEATDGETSVLEAVPIGGFEYLERIYVIVEPGPRHGEVLLWCDGLPPAWPDQLHEASIATIAGSLRELFQKLYLPAYPGTDQDDEFPSGADALEEISELDSDHPVEKRVKRKLEQLLSAAVADWEKMLDAGDGDAGFDMALRYRFAKCIQTDDAADLSRLLGL